MTSPTSDWRCGSCDTWNTGLSVSCMVCEEPVRDQWRTAAHPPAQPTVNEVDSLKPTITQQADPSSTSQKPSRSRVPLTRTPPPPTGPNPPPSIPLLIARSAEPEPDNKVRSGVMTAGIGIVIAVVAILALIAVVVAMS